MPFCFCFFLLFCFLFSAKATIRWYFIVGPLLAVTVLAFIALKLWKRRIAGTYTSCYKCIWINNAISQSKTPNMHYNHYKKQHNFILLAVAILEGESKLLSFNSEGSFFGALLVQQTQQNKIKSTKKNSGWSMKKE